MPVSEGLEISDRDVRFISSLVSSLGKLPGGDWLVLTLSGRFSHVQAAAFGVRTLFAWVISGPLESCHHQCLRAVLGYPASAAAERLDGTLKLRFCTTVFTRRFPTSSLLPSSLSPSVLLWSGRGVGRRYAATSDSLLDGRGNFGKQVRLGGCASQPFSSASGWVRLRRVSVEPASAGVPAGQSSRRSWCTGSCIRARMIRHACVIQSEGSWTVGNDVLK